MVAFRVAHLPLPAGASAAKIWVAPTTSTPPVQRAAAARERGTREAQPRFPLPQQRGEIRAVPRLLRRFGEDPNHNGEAPAP